MPEYQQRVVIEKAELDGKLSKLRQFMIGETFKKLPDAEQQRMTRQESAMNDYTGVLLERIEAFS